MYKNHVIVKYYYIVILVYIYIPENYLKAFQMKFLAMHITN